MRVPIAISAILLIVVIALTIWMHALCLETKDYIGLVIGVWTAAGALVSATFVVYGYLINLEVFRQSQSPKLLIFVDNAQATLIESGELVHQTRINYRNLGDVECADLHLFAKLINENETIEIPGLFSSNINLQPRDERVRDFPTMRYFMSNGIPKHVVDNLAKYNFRVGYSYRLFGKTIKREYGYVWNAEMQKWDIA
jgi:hypothetical protein